MNPKINSFSNQKSFISYFSKFNYHEIEQNYPKIKFKTEELKLNKNLDSHELSCFELNPNINELQFAVGFKTGNIVLSNINNTESKNFTILFQKDSPKNCNSISWNPIYFNQIASGYQKSQNGSIFIWDLNQIYFSFSNPIIQFDNQQDSIFLTWKPNEPNILFSCSKNGLIYIYDIKQGNQPVQIIENFKDESTIEFLEFDFVMNSRFGCLSNGNEFHWIPNQENSIGTISTEDDKFYLWNLQKGNGENQNNFLVKNLEEKPISFDCINNSSYSIGFLTKDGNVRIEKLFGNTKYSMFRKSNTLFLDDKSLFSTQKLNLENEEDISIVMKKRCLKNYSLNAKENVNVIKAFPNLFTDDILFIWNYLSVAENDPNFIFNGIEDILNDEKPQIINKVWNSSNFQKFKSQQRDAVEKLLQSLKILDENQVIESKSNIERWIFLKIINLDFEEVVSILKAAELTRSSHIIRFCESPFYGLLSLTISGYNEKMRTILTKMMDELNSTIEDPYLISLVTFLLQDKDSIVSIANNPKIKVQDRLLFASCFLDEKELKGIIQELKKKLFQEGNLHGIITTGIKGNLEFLELIQNFLDKTSDVQTTVLVLSSIYSLIKRNQETSEKLVEEKTYQMLMKVIDSYREYLNSNQLFEFRSLLDIGLHEKIGNENMNQNKPILKCNYCRKVMDFKKSKDDSNARIINNSFNDSKTWKVCPFCSKPLPKCCVCCKRINVCVCGKKTNSTNEKNSQVDLFFDVEKLDQSSLIFICLKCHHVYHISCSNNWFKNHSICPVSGCECSCIRNLKEISNSN
ncbi:gator complex protein [Anaeramoeba ignava]|uniref:Gator complex protein n=1 Tax=Anaeramoeba ignava TaxID=1746090 RepID=A0A9Q0LPP2_ANAIG|nr:gator complex protein [Anaeramoeba ignava]